MGLMTMKKTYVVLYYVLTLMLSKCQSFLFRYRKKIDPTAKRDLSNDVFGRSIAIFVKESDKKDTIKLPEWFAWKRYNESVYINPEKYIGSKGHNLIKLKCTQADRDKG